MDGQVDGKMHGQMERRMDGRMNGRLRSIHQGPAHLGTCLLPVGDNMGLCSPNSASPVYSEAEV